MSLVPLFDALAKLLDDVEPVRETETLPLHRLAGRVAAVDVSALRTQPPFRASAMDGYAVRFEDVAETAHALRIVGRSAAGAAFAGTLRPGEAVRIFTGAPVPDGADTVILQEDAVPTEGSEVRFTQPARHGSHIRPAGNDFTEGDRLVPAGARLRPAMVALAASGGHANVEVRRRPRVAVLATGDELVLPGEPLGPSQIVASNGFGIAAIAEANGADVIVHSLVSDREDSIGAAIDEALSRGADILVTIGGASVGDLDLVAPVMRRKGATLDFWKIAMRPGKPLMAGRLGSMRFLGLPGNPASSLTASEIFLAPLVAKLAGRSPEDRWRDGVLGVELPANDHRAEFMRSRVRFEDGIAMVLPFPRQDSSLLGVFSQANALLFREPNAKAATIGERCRYIDLG